MIKKLLTAAAVCAALSGGAAHASTFDFTYNFTDGQEIAGSFTGTSADGGQSATNISNLQVTFEGTAFTGGVSPTLILNSWNTGSAAFNSPSAASTIYANGSLNNFAISDVDASVNTSPDYEFAYINDATNSIYQVVGANFTSLQSQRRCDGCTLRPDGGGHPTHVGSEYRGSAVLPGDVDRRLRPRGNTAGSELHQLTE